MVLDIPRVLIFAILLLVFFKFVKWLIVKCSRWIREHFLLKKMAKSGIRDIDRMDGFQFEIYLKALLKELGYKSEVTKTTHDYGADLLMKKDGKKIVIQAKRYNQNNKVGIDAIQQVYAAKPFYKAHDCWVMTNSLFTKSARTLAKACGVNLYDRNQLMELINTINPNITAKQVFQEVEPKSRKCPSCSGNLIKRTSRTGNHFMGCSNYPSCNHTESIAK